MIDYKSVLRFYRDCFEADTRTFSLTNVFSSKFENRFFLSGKDELLNGHLPSVPINEQVAQPILENLNIYYKKTKAGLKRMIFRNKIVSNLSHALATTSR